MTPVEAGALLVYMSAFDNRQIDEEHGQAWADVLDPRLTLEGAKWIAQEHYKKSRQWLMPADINTKFKEVRRKRIDKHGNQIPYPLDLPTEKHLGFRRAWEDAIGNGMSSNHATEVACSQIGHDHTTVKLVGPPPELQKYITHAQKDEPA